MDDSGRHAALVSAAGSDAYRCEALERRVLLDGDPVIVLTEVLSLTTFENVTAQTVRPRLWENPGEFLWDLGIGNWNTTDGDGNTYPDDAYGWNFILQPPPGSPNFIDPGGGHGAAVMGKVLNALNTAGPQGDRVRIMHVIGSGSQIAQYVVAEKAQGANVVAVARSSPGGAGFLRADAETLRNAGILLFVAGGNAEESFDDDPVNPTASSLYHATPRFGIQQSAVNTIIPTTTDPGLLSTGYGVNSFYVASPGAEAPSYTAAIGAAYAGIAVEAYQEAHSGQNPTPEQVKRAMMSGVDYIAALDDKTITHDYVGGDRLNGGRLALSKVITSINQAGPGITNVFMTRLTTDPLGTEVQFSLNSVGEPTNWTISWGDNSFADQSGVQVLPGTLPSTQHTFPFENVPHHYFPTIYAMSGTDAARQVYLQSEQIEVVVTTPFLPTSGQDHYTLSRSGENTVLTLQRPTGPLVSHSFAPNQLPRCFITLGQGQDILTVDFSNGNPLASTALTVTAVPGSGALLRVIGTASADSISVTNGELVTVNGTQFRMSLNTSVFIDAGGGNDQVSAATLATTLLGGAGNDSITGVFGSDVINGGDGVDTLRGGSGTDTLDYNTFSAGVTINLTASTAGPNGTLDSIPAIDFENAIGGSGNDVITGNLLGNVLDGRAGADTIDGDDNGGTSSPLPDGYDSILGGDGNDSIVGDGGHDTIDGQAGNDYVNGGPGNDEITGGTGSDQLLGDAGHDDFYSADATIDTLWGGSGDDTALIDVGTDLIPLDDIEDVLYGTP